MDLDPRRFAELHSQPDRAPRRADRRRPRAARLDADYLERLERVQDRLDPRPRRRDVVDAARAAQRARIGLPRRVLLRPSSGSTRACRSTPAASGVLAGDHLKAASELGVPLVGIGLFYRRGYFRQRLDEHDRQIEHYPLTDTSRLPLELVPMAPIVELADDRGRARAGAALRVARAGRPRDALPHRHARRGESGLGASPRRLYGGDRANRLRQELLLGVGGVRVLRELGLAPTVFHLNEGHSAFLQLERMARVRRAAGLAPEEALERLRASTVFTTHTPVPAGNEEFDPELVRRERRRGSSRAAGSSWDDFVALGKVSPDEKRLRPDAVRAADVAIRERRVGAARRGVARDVARALARCAASTRSRSRSVTNGVHQRTWISGELEQLLGDTDPQFERAREPSPTRTCGRRTAARSGGCSASSPTTRGARELDPDVLTIGFARRFATYKRASLLFTPARPARGAARRPRAADPGARRRQGAPGRRGRQGR